MYGPPLTPDSLETCFTVIIVTWPRFEQEKHCVHYSAWTFWLTLFRSRPISCILFAPGPTSSTWKHPFQCRYTAVCEWERAIYSPWALLPSWFVNRLSLYHVKHVTACTASRLVLSAPVRQMHLSSAGRWQLHPEFSLEWHHTVTAVVASTHLPVMTLTSDWSCWWISLWTGWGLMCLHAHRKHHMWTSVQHM